MAATIESSFNPVHFHLRRLWRRWFTKLPYHARRFDELFPPDCDYLRAGVFRQRPMHTGMLQRERGLPYLVKPTCFWDGHPGDLTSEDRDYWTREPDRVVFSLSNAGVESSFGRVYDPESRAFIAETCENWDAPFNRSLVLALPGFPPPSRLPGRSILLGAMAVQTFYHFFVEALPKLALLTPYLDSCDHVLVSRYAEQSKLRWLSLWGLEDKVRILDDISHYHCDQLLFTNRVVRHFEPSPWCVRSLRNLPGMLPIPARVDPHGPVLWLDRRQDQARHTDWESALLDKLPGIMPVRLGDMSPLEAAQTMAKARGIVGLHGAAFANMVFAPPGLRVIEIFTKPNYPWYARLSQSCGHNHAAIVAGERPDNIDTLVSAIRSALET